LKEYKLELRGNSISTRGLRKRGSCERKHLDDVIGKMKEMQAKRKLRLDYGTFRAQESENVKHNVVVMKREEAVKRCKVPRSGMISLITSACLGLQSEVKAQRNI